MSFTPFYNAESLHDDRYFEDVCREDDCGPERVRGMWLILSLGAVIFIGH